MLPIIRVDVSITRKLTKAEQLLVQLPNRLQNLRPLMQRVIAPEVNNMLLKWWNSKGRAYGRSGWAEWAEATLAKRTRKGNVSMGILRDTDHLFKTLFRARSADSRLRLIPGGIKLSLNIVVRYAIFHQLGTENMPERQVIPDPLPAVFIKRIRSLVREFVLTGKVA
jgi:hypothetical protein